MTKVYIWNSVVNNDLVSGMELLKWKHVIRYWVTVKTGNEFSDLLSNNPQQKSPGTVEELF